MRGVLQNHQAPRGFWLFSDDVGHGHTTHTHPSYLSGGCDSSQTVVPRLPGEVAATFLGDSFDRDLYSYTEKTTNLKLLGEMRKGMEFLHGMS